MTAKLLRFAYVFEFLLALVAIFTAWSEIGGQAPLDVMFWGWKLGFGLALATAIVAYTNVIVSQESLWSVRSVSWLTVIGLLLMAIGVVTYYYAQETDLGTESDEQGTASSRLPALPSIPCTCTNAS
jgi:hypothetical protein